MFYVIHGGNDSGICSQACYTVTVFSTPSDQNIKFFGVSSRYRGEIIRKEGCEILVFLVNSINIRLSPFAE